MAQFTNQAQLSYNLGVVNSNVAVGQLLEVLSVTKTALRETYTVGDTVTYAVNLINSGTTAYNGLTLTDDLGGAVNTPLAYTPDSVRYFINGVLQPTPTVEAGPPLSISGITVPAGGNTLILYQTVANAFANPQADGSIVNTATVTGAGFTPLSATETVTAANAPSLSITKSINPVPVAENGRLTYTFLIQNTGNAEAVATDDVSVTDLFDPILSDLTVTFNGAVWEEGVNYTYDEATGLFTTIPSQITVPAATFVQNPDGSWGVTPGSAVLTVTGTV